MVGPEQPLQARRFPMHVQVSEDDLADAEAMRESERRQAAMTPAQRAEANRKREQERADQLAQAQADWKAVCERLAGNAPALAVLKVHHPVQGVMGWAECAHPVDGWEANPEAWPCETFTAIKEA